MRTIGKIVRSIKPLRKLAAKSRARKIARIRLLKPKITAEAIRLVESPRVVQGPFGGGKEYRKAVEILETLKKSGVSIGKYGEALMKLRHAEDGFNSGNPLNLEKTYVDYLRSQSEKTINEIRPIVEKATEAEKETLRQLIAVNANKLAKIVNP